MHGALRAAIVALCLPASATAQLMGRSIDVVGTAAVLAGVTPLRTVDGSRIGAHVGARLDGGLQFTRWSLGLGARGWAANSSASLESFGLEMLLATSRRIGGSVHTSLRATIGAGFEQHEASTIASGSDDSYGGVTLSAGAEHEFTALAHRFVVSVDVLMPPAPPGRIGRGRPGLEVGFGYRARRTQSIAPL